MTCSVRTTADLEYARVDSQRLRLDLHRPETADGEAPCVAYFHGGGWMRGDRRANLSERLHPLAASGVAVASVSHRFTDAATYPAQLHDAKAAIRWLRANAPQLGLRAGRIGAWGVSSGGWIALMLALTGEDRGLEGELGAHLEQSSTVQAACAWHPVADLTTPTAERERAGLPLPAFLQGQPLPEPSMEARLLGVRSIADAPQAARAASPIAHVGHASGPVLLIHGDADGLVNADQSRRLHRALLDAGQESQLLLIEGADHESQSFHAPAVLGAVAGFFKSAL